MCIYTFILGNITNPSNTLPNGNFGQCSTGSCVCVSKHEGLNQQKWVKGMKANHFMGIYIYIYPLVI